MSRNETVVAAKQPGVCSYCGGAANCVSLTFMAHICSVKCDEAYTDEYFEATWRPETLKEYKEAYPFLLEKLREERRLRVIAEHERDALKEEIK